MQHATRDSAACRSRVREISLRVRENGEFCRILRTRSSILRARKVMSSIFLSNRSTWRTKLNVCLTCHFQMYSTQAPVCWNESCHSIWSTSILHHFLRRTSPNRFSSGLVLCVPYYQVQNGKDILWCSRWCQRMFLPQKCINFLLRVYLSPISVCSTKSFPRSSTIYLKKILQLTLQTLRCRFCGFQFSNPNGWRIFDAKDAGTWAMKSRVSTLWPRSIYLDFTLRVAFVATLRFGLRSPRKPVLTFLEKVLNVPRLCPR